MATHFEDERTWSECIDGLLRSLLRGHVNKSERSIRQTTIAELRDAITHSEGIRFEDVPVQKQLATIFLKRRLNLDVSAEIKAQPQSDFSNMARISPW